LCTGKDTKSQGGGAAPRTTNKKDVEKKKKRKQSYQESTDDDKSVTPDIYKRRNANIARNNKTLSDLGLIKKAGTEEMTTEGKEESDGSSSGSSSSDESDGSGSNNEIIEIVKKGRRVTRW
jgi:hypothetical protein